MRFLWKGVDITRVAPWAKSIFFNRKNTNIESTNVQDAIVEVNDKINKLSTLELLGFVNNPSNGATVNLSKPYTDFKKFLVVIDYSTYITEMEFYTETIPLNKIFDVGRNTDSTVYYAITRQRFNTLKSLYITNVYKSNYSITKLSVYGINC